MPRIDDYREPVQKARKAGASVSSIARAIGFAPSTVQHALDRWERPDRPSPGEDALEALRRLVED